MKKLEIDKLAEKAFSKNTRRSYDKGFRKWTEYLQEREPFVYDTYTDDEETACGFPLFLAEKKLSLSSINLYVQGVVWHYTQEKKYCPLRSAKAKAVMKGLAREIGKPQRRVRALSDVDIESMIRSCPDNLKGVRDAAMLALGFACALRRSELCELQVSDVEIDHKDGIMSVLIRRSKTDKTGQGRTILTPRGDRIRPLDLVHEWLTQAGIKDGYLFRGITRGGHVRSGDKSLHPDSLVKVIKELAGKIGIPPEKVSGHSLRSGFATTAARYGARLDKIMEVTGHKQPGTVLKYIRDENKLKDHAGEGFL